jgi:ABC-2 type transport system permease protein
MRAADVRAAWLICLKDLKARIRDRSAPMIGIVVPLGLAIIFNAIFGSAAGNSKAIDLGVVDADHGPVAGVLVNQVLGNVGRSGLIAIHQLATEAEARARTANGSFNAVIVIPPGFSGAVQSNQPASLQVIGNVDSPISAEIARSIAEGFSADLNGVRLAVATVLASAGGGPTAARPERVQLLAARAAAAGTPVAVQDASTTTKELNPKTFYAAGMAVFFVFFTVQFGVTSMLEERSNGTMARLLAAPIARGSILGGKLLTSFLLGSLSMGVLVVATSVLFGASWGNPVGVAVLIAAAVLAAMGIMSLITTLARTAEQAANWQSVIAVVLGLFGGTFFPVSRAPGVLSKLTFVTPQAWFLRGLGDLRGGQLSVIWLPTLAMAGFAVVAGGIAMTRLRKLAEF